MGEMKGAMMVMFLNVAFLFPFLLFMAINDINHTGFLVNTQLVSGLVKQAGGVDAEVQSAIDNLEARSLGANGNEYSISVSPASSSYGDEITIVYNYKYQNLKMQPTLTAVHKVVNTRR